MTKSCGRSFATALAVLLASALIVQAAGCSRQPDQSSQQQPAAAPAPPPAAASSTPATQPPDAATQGSGGAAAPAAAPAARQGGAPNTGNRPARPSEPAAPLASTPAAAPHAVATPPPPPPPPPPRVLTLPSGTQLSVYTTSTLSTNANETGEPFTATLAEAIVDGDWVVAKRGAHVEGVIVDADKGGRTSGVASMSIALKSLTLADGRVVPLSTSAMTQQAKSSKGKDAKRIGVGAGLGAAIGGIAGGGKGAAIGAAVGGGGATAATLATRGDPAVVPAETKIDFALTSPISITEQR